MKKSFAVLKDRHKIQFEVTRDSVCLGDDCDAPHKKEIECYSFLDPKELIKEIYTEYIPKVAGSGGSWTCFLNEKKIAIIEEGEINPLVIEVQYEDENRIHFTYH